MTDPNPSAFEEKANQIEDEVMQGKFFFPALVPAIAKALEEAAEAERQTNMETLYGLLPLDKDPILDGIRGALLHAIGLIDMRRSSDAVAFLRSIRGEKDNG